MPARRRAPAPSTTRPPTRTTRSASCAASSPTCRQNVWEAAADHGVLRTRATAARRTCCRSSRARAASPTRRAASSRRCSTAARVFEIGASFGRPLITALGRLDGPSRRRPLLRPQPLRRWAQRGRLREAHALRRHVRPVPPAGRELRRPARLRDRHRGRAARHHPARHARAGRRLSGDGAVGVGARAQGVRRRGRGARAAPRVSTCATRGRRATGARCRSRAASRPPTGASSRRPPDPAALRDEIENRLNAVRSPFRTAERFGVEEIIDPRDTRPLLCDWAERAHELVAPRAARQGPKRRGLRP